MFQYLEKFKKLPKELQKVVSSPEASQIVNELEKKYRVDLASLVIKIMVKDVSWGELENVLKDDFKLDGTQAVALKKELEEKIFYQVRRYLQIPNNKFQVTSNKEQVASDKSQVTSNKEQVASNAKSIGNDKWQKQQGESGDSAKLNIVDTISKGDEEVEKDTQKVAKAIGFDASRAEDMRRLTSIIKTFKKGIRDELDTIDALQKDKNSGGLALTLEQAEQVVSVAGGGGKARTEKLPSPSIKPGQNFHSIEQIRDVEYDLSQLEQQATNNKEQRTRKNLQMSNNKLSQDKQVNNQSKDRSRWANKMTKDKKKQNKMPIPEFSEEELEHELAPPPPVKIQNLPVGKQDSEFRNKEESNNKSNVETWQSDNLSKSDVDEILNSFKDHGAVEEEKNQKPKGFVISPESLKQAEEEVAKEQKIAEQRKIKREEETANLNMQRPRVINNRNKPQVNDIIKPQRMLEGPIEELANLDLVNFRRLSEDPQTAITKIKQKIDLLEEESFTKRHQGVSAWRQSQTYKIYIELGRESIEHGISVKDVIKKKENLGEEILTIEEFNAILELNKELRV